jgi:hypothetical protein
MWSAVNVSLATRRIFAPGFWIPLEKLEVWQEIAKQWL